MLLTSIYSSDRRRLRCKRCKPAGPYQVRQEGGNHRRIVSLPSLGLGYRALTRRSLAAGQFATYETISSWGYLFAAGLGNAEHTLTVSVP